MEVKGVHGGNRLIKLYQGMASGAMHTKPVSPNMMSKAEINEYWRKEYFNLIRKLYGISFLCQHGNAGAYSNPYEALQKQWSVLLELCVNSQMIYEHVDSSGDATPRPVPDSISNFRFTYHYPEMGDEVHVATFDDFRLVVEMELCGKDVEWYLHDRYKVRPVKDSTGECFGLTKYSYSMQKEKSLSLVDISGILRSITTDIQHVNAAITSHSKTFPSSKNNGQHQTRQEFIDYVDSKEAWIAKRYQLDRELHWLNACSDIVESATHYFESPVNQQSDAPDLTLYVHKGYIVCHKQKHDIEQATAILKDIYGRDIKLNVSHCVNCNKFFIHHSVYKTYRERYGTVLGDVKLLSGEYFDSFSPDLSDESTLHLCGYNVSQKSKLSMVDRQTIIATVIDNGTMSKAQVINLLQYLIDLAQNKDNMKLAIAKWQDDLEFTLAYNTAKQKQYIIHKVAAYAKNQFIIHTKTSATTSKQNSSYVGKTVIHHDPKFGRGTIIAATKDTVTIQFDNGKYSDFSKTIFSKNLAHFESNPNVSPASSIMAHLYTPSTESKHKSVKCIFKTPSNFCTNPDAPRYQKGCALCMYFTGKDNFKLTVSKKTSPQSTYPKPSQPKKATSTVTETEKPVPPANPKKGCIHLDGNYCKIRNAPCNCGSSYCLFYKTK